MLWMSWPTWGAPVGVTGESSTAMTRFFRRWALGPPNSLTRSFNGKLCRSWMLTNPRAWSLLAVWWPIPKMTWPDLKFSIRTTWHEWCSHGCIMRQCASVHWFVKGPLISLYTSNMSRLKETQTNYKLTQCRESLWVCFPVICVLLVTFSMVLSLCGLVCETSFLLINNQVLELLLSLTYIPGTLRRLLREPMMSQRFSGSSVVCWLGLKAPDTSLARSLFVAMPAQPVRPSLLWMASLSSAAMCEPTAILGWSLALTFAPEQE